MASKQRNAAITAKIKRYTQEHTATKDLALEAIERATMTNKTEAMDSLIAQDADLIDAQPTQSDAMREAVIEECANALEADAKLCDCFALEERECGCGAWCEWKSITSARAVEIVCSLGKASNETPR